MLWVLALAIALMAGAMSIALFYAGLKIEQTGPQKTRAARSTFIWAVMFLGAAFGGLEWAFYLLGYNMFTFFAFPLVAFFGIWFGWIIWLFERRGERRIWMSFLVALAVLTVIAFNCMNCLAALG
ncbi:MAG: hypothetical protein QW548_01930 [Candidatus Aenigmatarchaeota archaeon]